MYADDTLIFLILQLNLGKLLVRIEDLMAQSVIIKLWLPSMRSPEPGSAQRCVISLQHHSRLIRQDVG